MSSDGDAILNALKGLTDNDFREFCYQLTDPVGEDEEPCIPLSEVDGKDRATVKSALVTRLGPEALDVTVKTLEAIRCRSVALWLKKKKPESAFKPAPGKERSGEIRPGPGPLSRPVAANDAESAFKPAPGKERSGEIRPGPGPLSRPVAANDADEENRETEVYPVNSIPRGVCLIVNNIHFVGGDVRKGTEIDAKSLAETFDWLGFTVVMCVDKTREEMSQVFDIFSTLGDTWKLPHLGLSVWSKSAGFVPLQQDLQHGDAFICCILTHGNKGVVCGIDGGYLAITEVTRKFKTSPTSPLFGKPKVFLIEACQGGNDQLGAVRKTRADGGFVSRPEDADVLVAIATVQDYAAFRDEDYGTWFIQCLCIELKNGCPSGTNIYEILQRVNGRVAKIEGKPNKPGLEKQQPEIRSTMDKTLILRPVAI